MGITITNGLIIFSNSFDAGYVQCVIESNGIVNGTCTQYSSIASLPAPRGLSSYNNIMYFTSMNSDSYLYTQCNMTILGVLNSSCAMFSSSDISISPVNTEDIAFDESHAYMSYYYNDAGLIQCNLVGGIIDNNSCFTIPNSGNMNLDMPHGVTIYKNYIFIVNQQWTNGQGYTQCNLNSNGIDVNSCTSVTNLSLFNQPIDMAIYNDIAYFTNSSGNYITQCNMNSTGVDLSSCVIKTPTGIGALREPGFISINPIQ